MKKTDKHIYINVDLLERVNEKLKGCISFSAYVATLILKDLDE